VNKDCVKIDEGRICRFRGGAGDPRRFGSKHIGTDHLLLALALRGDGIAAHALIRCGANAERIREEITTMKLKRRMQTVRG